MTLEVDFLPFANGSDAVVTSQANWAARNGTGQMVDAGFPNGILEQVDLNKAIRQPSVMMAALANAISATLNENVLDSGGAASVAALQAQIVAMVQAASAAALPPFKPQGRLTLTTGTPVLTADVIAATVAYYTAYEGNQLPVWNGSQFLPLTFPSDLTLSLTSAATANNIVDVFAINVSGSPVLGFGPVWGNSGAGAGARGSGAGTTQLVRMNGLWTNANIITLLNGASTYTAVPANQATYLASLFIDGTAGQVSCTQGYGQSRKWGVWNAYNRKRVLLQAGDPTSSWSYLTAAWRASNNASTNNITVFTGLPEEMARAVFCQAQGPNEATTANTPNGGLIGIGLNSTSSPSGRVGKTVNEATSNYNAMGSDSVASLNVASSLGINILYCIENSLAANNSLYNGTSSYMELTADYMA